MSASLFFHSLFTVIWWRRLWVMTVKELLQLARDTALAIFLVYGFTLHIYLAGEGISLQLKKAVLVVHDADHSFASRDLIYRFRPPYFYFAGELTDAREGGRLLDQGKAMVMLDIPPRFQESLLQGEPMRVQLQVDASNSVIGFLAASYSAQIVERFVEEASGSHRQAQGKRFGALPFIKDEHRVWYNPNQNSAWFMTISELLAIVTIFAILLPASAMAREKERGTVEQLLVSPLTPVQIMLPKVLAMTLVVVIGTSVSVLVIMQPLFQLPMKGSFSLFLALTALYTFSTAGLGLLVVSFTRNLAQVGMMSILIAAPIIVLSGIWTPPEAMPTWLRYLMTLSPLFYFIDASYGILLRGAGLVILWKSTLGLALLGGGTFGLGVLRFRRQFA